MPSPTSLKPESPDHPSIASRLAKLSPAQRVALEKKLAQRAASGGTDPSSSEPVAENQLAPSAIAIVGMGCRMPGADNPDEFWELIRERRETVGPVPENRWRRDDFYDPSGRTPGKMSVDAIGAINHVDSFDPAFFGIAPREASRMDPQQRVLLEVTWETIENAGIPINKLSGTKTGVFIGIGGTDYSKIPSTYPDYYEQIDAHMGTGNALSIAAGRISYLFDFHGPSYIVDTACSSALVAIHNAAVSLVRGESDSAIAGGVNLILSPETTIAFSKARMLSPEGRCCSFDASAAGYVRGEGCGLVLMRRAVDAIRDGNRILGFLRGSAVNQDGRTSGITAPNSDAQVRVLADAIAAAKITVDDLSYIEAHGTGTPLGDPIEMTALSQTLAARNGRQPAVRVGSVKANIGHTETVSGVAGLLKVLQMFQHQTIPGQANFNLLNPNIQLDPSKIKIATENETWSTNDSGRRIAGVSSFGFGGTNAHVILESSTLIEATPPNADTAPAEPKTPPCFFLPLSTRSPDALTQASSQMKARIDIDLAAGSDEDENRELLHNLCGSLAKYRSSLVHRAVVVGENVKQVCKGLTQLSEGQLVGQRLITGKHSLSRRVRTAMLFTGQGSQYASMGMELYRNHEVFRTSVDDCSQHVEAHLGHSLVDLIKGKQSEFDINHTSIAQPTICAIQIALVDSLRHVGIRPDVIAGHSIGEIAALYAIDALSREQAMLLATFRGQAMGGLPEGGAMVAILTDASRVQSWIDQNNSNAVIATMNGPQNTVIAGTNTDVIELVRRAESEDVLCRRLSVSHAFHSPLMQDAVEPLRHQLGDLLENATIPYQATFISSVTGAKYEGPINADYWIKHLLSPVRFTDVIDCLHEEKLDLAMEIGPRPQLARMVERSLPSEDQIRTATTLTQGGEDYADWLSAVAEAWSVGVDVEFGKLDSLYPSKRVDLPNYPFQRQRYWYDPPAIESSRFVSGGHAILGSKQSLASGGLLFLSYLAENNPGFLLDHKVSNSVTIPAAAWIDAMAVAAREAFIKDSSELSDICIHKPTFLSEHQRVEVQTTVGPILAGSTKIEIYVKSVGDESSSSPQWNLVASATARIQRSFDETIKRISNDSAESFLSESFYEDLARSGLQYGSSFQPLDNIRSFRSSAEATLSLDPSLEQQRSQCCLHPTLIDGAIQLVATTIGSDVRNSETPPTFLPVSFERFAIQRDECVSSVRVRRRRSNLPDASVKEIIADIQLFDSENNIVGELQGVTLRRLQQETIREDINPSSWIHRKKWQSYTLEQSQSPCHRPIQFEANQYAAGGHWVWTPYGTSAFEASNELLKLLQQAIPLTEPPAITILVRSSGSVQGESSNPVSTAVAAMARVAANEHPQLEVRIINLDDEISIRDERVLNLLRRSDNETEYAIRGDQVYVPRLLHAPSALSKPVSDDGLGLPHGGQFRMRLDGTNRTNGLWLERMAPEKPNAGEVAVEVRAVGLNFSDVLKAMGLYPGITDKVVPLGIEVCGIVTEIGSEVTRLKIGQRVMGVVPHGFASHVMSKEYLLAEVPEHLDDEEAASLPIAFMTAHHALRTIGRLEEGESILIHAGAGGVGLAAIQVAASIGATIFATAGNETKRRILSQLGIPKENIFDSRDVQSISAIKDLTDGRGVDMVLNSLPDAWIEASLGQLAAHGRFLEIGKTDIYQNRAIGLSPFQDNLSYSAIDLDRLFRQRPTQVERLFEEVRECFEKGEYEPTMLTSFPLSSLSSAMRFMSARRNIGKIVVEPPKAKPDLVSSDGSYLISGGSGSIAVGVAKRLIQRGATSIVLVARREIPERVKQLIRWATKYDATVEYLQADCSREVELRNALSETDHQFVGVVHTAGMLDDSLLHEISEQSLRDVIRAKVDSAIALANVTIDHPVKMFNMLGSVASVFGSPGQANYAAANGYLEGFAKQLRNAGRAANVVHWGPWAAASQLFDESPNSGSNGMADDPIRIRNLASRGLRVLRYDQSIDLLIDASHPECPAQCTIVDADWAIMLKGGMQISTPSIFRSLYNADDSSHAVSVKDDALVAELSKLPTEERSDRLQEYFAVQLGQIMSLDPDLIDRSQALAALGLDSLMAIELKNTIETKLSISIPIRYFMEEPSIESLAVAASAQITSDSKND